MRVARACSVFLAAVVAAAGMAVEAVAEESSAQMPEGDAAYSRNGGFVGAGGGFVLESFDRPGFYDNSGVLTFRAGYRGMPNVAVELLGEVLPEFEGRQTPDGDVDGYAVTANGKLFLPFGRLEPWLMGGVGFLVMDADHRNDKEDIAFRFATGADLYLTPHWAIYLEAAYMLPTGEVSDYRYSQYSAGFLLRF